MHPVERMALSYRSWPCQRKHHTARKCSASDAWRPPTGAGHASENNTPHVNATRRAHGALLQELAMLAKTNTPSVTDPRPAHGAVQQELAMPAKTPHRT